MREWERALEESLSEGIHHETTREEKELDYLWYKRSETLMFLGIGFLFLLGVLFCCLFFRFFCKKGKNSKQNYDLNLNAVVHCDMNSDAVLGLPMPVYQTPHQIYSGPIA